MRPTRYYRNTLEDPPEVITLPDDSTPDDAHLAMNRVIDFDILSRQPDPDNYELTPTDIQKVRKVWEALGLI